MKLIYLRAVAAAAFLASVPLLTDAAATPAPMPFPSVQLPNKRLHVSLIVEVNERGQVVRVDHGTLSTDRAFDTMALGNAMQMWIRRPDGSATVGLYRVNYDYDPGSHAIARFPSLLKKGGAWANKPGAATLIVKDAQRQAQAAETRLRAQQRRETRMQAKNLPDIHAAIKRAMVKPTAKP